MKFYTDKTPAQGATPVYTVDFPAEMVLDQASTTLVDNFVFSTDTYGTATTNPNLDGKPVLVLGVKTTDAQNNVTVNYSFLSMYKLVDTYTVKTGDSSKILVIDGYEIEVKISATAGNALSVENDGLYVDISGKADRDTDATLHNIAYFDATGTPVDANIAATDLVLTSMIAPDSDVNTVLTTYFGTNAGA